MTAKQEYKKLQSNARRSRKLVQATQIKSDAAKPGDMQNSLFRVTLDSLELFDRILRTASYVRTTGIKS